MADFNISFAKTMGHEGYYANDPADVGGETWCGVARNYHPTWSGWKIIDAARSENGFPNILKSNVELANCVKIFYKNTFWNVWLGDQIPNQDIADEMFDTGVNQGVSRAITYLQQALNVLNKNGIIYADLVEDGSFGQKTMDALNVYLRSDKPSLLLKIMNVLQGCHYIEYMRKSPTQEKFCRGWFSRVEITKT